MKKKNSYLSGLYMVQLAIGIYFFISGLLGIMGYNSGTNQLFNDVNKLLGKSNYLPLIISISFLVVGLFLVVSLFLTIKSSSVYLVVFIIWIVYIVYKFFTNSFMEPELLVWLKNLSRELIILSGLWAIGQKR